MLAELAAEVVTIERVPELAEAARGRLARPATRTSRYASATARSACPSERRSRRSRSPRPRRQSLTPCTSSSPRAAGSSSRGARGGARSSCSSSARRPGPSSVRRSRAASCRSWATKGLGMTDRMGGGDDGAPDYPAMTVESSHAPDRRRILARPRARRHAQAQELGAARKFCVVGASGYVVNLAVYALLRRRRPPLHLRGSRLVPRRGDEQLQWNRLWTFRAQRGGVAYQGMRFLVVSTIALAGEPRRPARARHHRARGGRRAGDRDRARHAGELRRQ